MEPNRNIQPYGNNHDLSVGPAAFMEALMQTNPWMNPYQAAHATNLVMQEAATIILQNKGGVFGVLVPGKPAGFIAIEPIQRKDGDK